MENIPDQILLKILKMLDKKTIETAADVCQRWQQLVGSSTVLMNRLDLIIDMKNPLKLKQAVKRLGQLPYKFLIIKPKYFQDQKVLNQTATTLAKHASHIERLEFFLASSSTILKIIGSINADKITRLIISQAYKEYIGDEKFVDLPNLKHLETHQASGLLKLIRTHNIENLQVIHDYDDYDTTDEKIQDFLLTCPDLKTLVFEHHFPVFNIDLMPFKLTNLTVSNIEETPKVLSQQQFQALKKLLEANFSTLEFFLLGNYSGIDGLLEFILPRVRKLQYLYLVCPTFKKIDDFLCKNRTVTDMAITLAHISDPDVQKTRKIIENCVAIEKLGLNSITHDVSPLIHEAARSLPNLKRLSIYNTTGKLFNHIPKFDKLETLYVERVSKQNDIKSLVNVLAAAPNLKKFTVEMWGGERLPYLSKERLCKVLTVCKQLEEISIGGLFKLPKSFVDGLIETESAVRKLTIETYDVDMIVENAKRLLDTKVKCTSLLWVSKRRQTEEEDDNDDYDYGEYDWMEFGESDDGLDYGNDRIVFGDVESSNDDDGEEDEEEADDRFDEFGRRRSKRLRLDRN